MEFKKNFSLSGLLVWVICALFFMYEFLLRTVLGTFQSQLMHDLHLTTVMFAVLSSTAYLLIYGLVQIPVGVITDRFGLKKALFLAVAICAVANLGFSLTHTYRFALLFRVLMGLGSSFGFVCLLVAVYDWMPRKNIALFIGISQFIGTLGPMLAAGPLNALSQTSFASWRGVFFSMAVAAIFLALLVLLFVRNNQQTQGKFIVLTRSSAITKNIMQIMKQSQIWYIALYSGCVYFAMEYFSENIGITLLIKKGFSDSFSSYMITLAWFSYALSCPILGYISDKIQRRKPIMLVAALMVLFSLVGIIYLPIKETFMAACFIFLGFGASGQSLGFAAIAEQCKEDYLAVGLSFNNGIILLFAALGAPVIGSILSHSAHLQNYKQALFIVVIFGLLAVTLASFAIRETFCKSMRENTLLSLEPAT